MLWLHSPTATIFFSPDLDTKVNIQTAQYYSKYYQIVAHREKGGQKCRVTK